MPKQYPILEALRTACADHRAGNERVAEAFFIALGDTLYPEEHVRAVLAFLAIHGRAPTPRELDHFIKNAQKKLRAAYPSAA